MKMDSRTTITTAFPADGHGFKAGDFISLTVRDTRWWRRALYWMLRRGHPQRTIKRRVSQTTDTTLTLD
jgi:hypothetical protein